MFYLQNVLNGSNQDVLNSNKQNDAVTNSRVKEGRKRGKQNFEQKDEKLST